MILTLASLLSWLVGNSGKWLALSIVLAGAVFFHQYAARQAIDHATAAAMAAADARWQAALDQSNAQAQIELSARQAALDEAAHAAATSESELADRFSKLEAASAALPNARKCGLDRDRVRLLNRLR